MTPANESALREALDWINGLTPVSDGKGVMYTIPGDPYMTIRTILIKVLATPATAPAVKNLMEAALLCENEICEKLNSYNPTRVCRDLTQSIIYQHIEIFLAKHSVTGKIEPIATAPKDGTRVLAYFPCDKMWCTASFNTHTRPDGTLAYAYWVNDPDNSREEACYNGYPGEEPTYWMKLPEIPH